MSRRVLAVLTLLVALSTLFSPLERDLFVGDETKYGQIIREMRRTGSLLIPTLEGRPYSHKPPLHFWLMWALSFPFGTESIWPFVAPSLLAYGLLIWIAGRLARALFGGEEWLARFIVTSFWLIWGLAQTARMDLEFTLAIAGAALLIWKWLGEGGAAPLLGAGALTGLAIFVKGPMALVIVMVLFAAQALRGKKEWRWSWAGALAIAVAIPLVWLVPALIAGGRGYSHELLVTQNLGRAVGAWDHAEPPWFYLLHFPVTFLPWSLVAVPALAAVWKRDHGDARAARFCLDWFLAVLVPFSLLSGKLDVYMAPAMIPLGLLIARLLGQAGEDALEAWGRRLSRALVGGLGLSFAAALAIGPRLLEGEPERALAEMPLVRATLLASVAAACIGLAFQLRTSRAAANAVIAALVSLFPLVSLGAVLMPVANAAVSSGPLVDAIALVTVDGTEVGLYGAPHLWARDLPPTLREVQYLGAGALGAGGVRPRVLAVRRDKAPELGEGLAEYRRVGGTTLKGKEFDVYRRE
ncbi:MAG TPA: glycosyltransferase family 39 protein [Thermoanaerobaculia bacterium]|nr:glycosyltransferase family 39 protein [Thermoanaerobaculia bacterium]